MIRIFKIALFLTIILYSCGNKYQANFYTESTVSFIPIGGTTQQKTFTAKNEKEAYRKGLEMLIELEEKNQNEDFIYNDVEVFNDSDGSFLKLSKDEKIELKQNIGLDILLKRKEEKGLKRLKELLKNDTGYNRMKEQLFKK